jgi:hypothetical protein
MNLRGVGDRWLAGEPVDGVRFGLNEDVEVLRGPHAGASGSILLLLSLHPEPVYLVGLGSRARDVRVPQSALRRRV